MRAARASAGSGSELRELGGSGGSEQSKRLVREREPERAAGLSRASNRSGARGGSKHQREKPRNHDELFCYISCSF